MTWDGKAQSNVVLYDDGTEKPLAIEAATAIPANTPGLLVVGSDGTNARFIRMATDGTVRVDPTGTTTQPVSVSALPLPTGAATEATLATRLTEATYLARTNTLGQKAMVGSVPVVFASDQSPLAITAVSLPLPTGAATEATLASLEAKDFATETTQATLLTEADFDARVGEVQPTPTTNTILGRLKDIFDAIVARLGTLGQKAMAGSTPVVIASDQSNVDINVHSGAGTAIAAINDAGTQRLAVDASINNEGSSADLANRTLVSTQFIIADHVFRYGINSREWDSVTVGAGAVTTIPDQSAARMAVDTGATDEATLRTHRYYRYQAGKTVSAELTGYVEALPSANQAWEMGLQADEDGVFFRLTNSGPEFVIRSSSSGSVVENIIPQASWNTDKFDGTAGNSASLDFTKGNIFGFRYKWLGYGRVEFQLNEIVAHVEANANIREEPFLRSATLPLHACMLNTGAATANAAAFICAKLDMEGGDTPPAIMNSAGNAAVKSISTPTVLFSLRNKATFGGVENRLNLVPTLFSVSTETGSAVVELILNGTLGGTPSWTSVSADSSAEFDIAGTTVTGGRVLQRFFLAQAQDTLVLDLNTIFDLKKEVLRLSQDGTVPDVLSVNVDKLKGGSTDMASSITFAEL
jgi:hypothetical protein